MVRISQVAEHSGDERYSRGGECCMASSRCSAHGFGACCLVVLFRVASHPSTGRFGRGARDKAARRVPRRKRRCGVWVPLCILTKINPHAPARRLRVHGRAGQVGRSTSTPASAGPVSGLYREVDEPRRRDESCVRPDADSPKRRSVVDNVRHLTCVHRPV